MSSTTPAPTGAGRPRVNYTPDELDHAYGAVLARHPDLTGSTVRLGA